VAPDGPRAARRPRRGRGGAAGQARIKRRPGVRRYRIVHGRPCAAHAPWFSIVPKHSPAAIERIVEELMDRGLSKTERMQRLRELAKSGEDVPDELMDQALRKLMERLTE
jgi:hypothetical protein